MVLHILLWGKQMDNGPSCCSLIHLYSGAEHASHGSNWWLSMVEMLKIAYSYELRESSDRWFFLWEFPLALPNFLNTALQLTNFFTFSFFSTEVGLELLFDMSPNFLMLSGTEHFASVISPKGRIQTLLPIASWNLSHCEKRNMVKHWIEQHTLLTERRDRTR